MRFAAGLRRSLSCGALIRRMILAWITSAAIRYIMLPAEQMPLDGLESLKGASFGGFVLLAASLFAGFTLMSCIWDTERAERWTLTMAFALYLLRAYLASKSLTLLASGGVCLVILTIYAVRGAKTKATMLALPPRGAFSAKLAVGVAATLFAAFVSAWTVLRVKAYCTPSYDFGIFSQMFHAMATDGSQLTTLERGELLQHFSVHISPVYYLLLPFYLLVPKPETLQVLQALLLASAVVPLWLIARRRGLSALLSAIFCCLLLLYPAYAGGASYDLHENAFLTPLLFWLFYAVDAENHWLLALSALLTLTVKEDSAVYVAVAGLWLLLRGAVQGKRRTDLLRGGAFLIGALVYFFLVTSILNKSGEGVMNWRYGNMIYDGSGSLLAVVKACLLNPLKALYECFETEKVKYILQTLLPLLFLPLITRRYERYVLLIPFLLVNLLSDYTYQHNIMFQYNFGSLAFLFYLSVINFADLRPILSRHIRIPAAFLALLVSLAMFATFLIPTAGYYFKRYSENRDIYAQMDELLTAIPDDSTVTATTFLTTRLSNRRYLYDLQYVGKEKLLSSEYVVLGGGREFKMYNGTGGVLTREALVATLKQNGFVLQSALDGWLEIYYREDGKTSG